MSLDVDWSELTPATTARVFCHLARSQLERAQFECIRMNGDALCAWCGRRYADHPRPEPEVVPTLHVDCEGRRVKT
jgi:hypothetical protein